MQKQKPNYRPILFTIFLVVIAAAAVMYFTADSSPKALPKIKLSYFKDNTDFVASIEKSLHLEITKNKYFWIGYEPEKANQLDLTILLKQQIEKLNGTFDVVIVDKELMLSEEQKKSLAMTHVIALKENVSEAAELIKVNKDKKTLVITAAIYSTNLISINPQARVKEIAQDQPLAFSLGFFPSTLEDERFTLFKCDTEDKTGTSPWACALVNKARSIRRRIDLEKLKNDPMPRLGLMDVTGEKDYMILVGR
ncbi:MAG: hypothetical protein V4654_06730 [Bdellovibrionota bacterium]